MTQVQVKSADVIKLILQFLKENNLHESFDTLQKESKITMNTVNSNNFINSIMQDNWDQALVLLGTLMLNQEHLFNIYQLMLDDLLQHDRYQAAQFIIKTFVKRNIKNLSIYRQRLMRLEYIIDNPQEKALHRKIVTEHRKRQAIKQCLYDIHEQVEESRLMKLLTQAIKYQSAEGVIKPSIKLNLFEGRQKIVQQQQQTIIKSVQKVINYTEDAKINCIALSCGEEYLALGGFDGLIEIYNTIDYSLHTGLKFQANDQMLYHQHPITLMEFNHTDQILASGDTSGTIKIWNLQKGNLLRKIQSQVGVSCLCWGLDPAHLLLGYQDIKLYGIRSCLVLKEYSVSAGDFMNKILVSQNKIFAVTNSGLVKLFNYATQQELISTNLRQTVINVLPIYVSRGSNIINRVIISTPKRIYELGRSGEQECKYPIEVGELINSVCVGEYLYQFIKVQDKSVKMNVISRSSGKNVYYCALDNEVTFCVMQRCKNLMISYDDKHHLHFWRQIA